MKDSKYVFLIVLLNFLVGFSMAQLSSEEYSGLSKNRLKKLADHAMREKDYFQAIDYLEIYLSKSPTDSKASYDLAEMYRLTRDYEKARLTYTDAYALDPKKNALSLYYLGRMQMAEEYYEEALLTLKKFRKEYRDEKNAVVYRKLAKESMEGCELAMADSIRNEKIQLNHLDNGINMAYNENSPTFLSNTEMLFSSLRSDTIISYEDSTYRDTSIHQSRFFVGRFQQNSWELKGEFEGPESFNDAHIGNAVYSLDSSKMYFTICRENWKYDIVCDIYAAEFQNNEWGEIEKLPDVINDKSYSSTHPCVGLNPRSGNEILYFASNRKDGRGGFDLWYSEKKNGQFTEARNCGGRMNTAGDEITPFFDMETSTIYFSSNGHPTYGEHDIFRSFGNKSKWMKNPENLGKPFNTSADDLYYHHGSDPKTGFVVSNRKGGIALKNPTCCDDIYFFEYDEILRYIYRAQIVSDDSTVLIQDGDVQVFLRDEENGDTTYLKTVDVKEDGSFNLRVERGLHYLLIVESSNHFVEAKEIPPSGEEFDFTSTDTISITRLTDRSFRLENIYYDFDDWKLTDLAKHSIDSFLYAILVLNPDIKVEISSHTDAKGSGEYNIRLSQKRAESVVQYLRSKGIKSSRMIAKGYGKTRPIAPNTNPDGTDNPEGRQLNRRTEFKVIGFEEKVDYKKIPTNKYAR